MNYSTLELELQFTDKQTYKFSFSPLDPSALSAVKANILNYNAILKDEEPIWYGYIANESGAKVDTDAGIIAAAITTYNETTIV